MILLALLSLHAKSLITFDKEKLLFHLQTKSSSYQMQVRDFGYLLHLYYGARVEDTDLSYLIRYMTRDFDANPYDAGKRRNFSVGSLLQEISTFGIADLRTPAINVINPDGSDALDLRYVSYEITNDKPILQGLPSVRLPEGSKLNNLKITLRDKYTNMTVILQYSVFYELDTITRSAQIINSQKGEIYITKAMSMTLDFPTSKYDLIHFYGKPTGEKMFERAPIVHGRHIIESIRGVSSHQHNPFVILADRRSTEDFGECYGMSFVYSGNFMFETEIDGLDQLRINMGINPISFRYHLGQDEIFQTPEVILTYNADGFAKLSHKIHKLFRHNLCRGKWCTENRRPVLINNWEATYMTFDEEKLVNIAKAAAPMGIDMLVMDDGWFGHRDDDLSSLGDWFINKKKLPLGLNHLVDRINKLGMSFGIWFEPEAVSEDSELYKAHPDYAIHIPGREPCRQRYELILDMSRKEVRDNIWNQMNEILKSANISYVKWDFNRQFTDLWSSGLPSNRQGELYHRYVLGFYDLMERLHTNYPDIMLEGCASGGGRFDPGVLYYAPQIWTSDDTDPIERIKIQYGSSFGYPISSMGSHVSKSPNEQTRRVTPFETRGIVAMSGSFGYELDLTKITEEEVKLATQQVKSFKAHYDLIQSGLYYRLSNPFTAKHYHAWMYVAEDQTKALVHIVRPAADVVPPQIFLRLKGLSPKKTYKCSELKATFTGEALMNAGLPLPIFFKEFEANEYELIAQDSSPK